MKNLLKISDLSTNEVISIIKKADELTKVNKVKQFPSKIVANLFFENSTRTHYSFLVAEEKLGCKSIDFAVSSSSVNKGETFHDTVKTFASFGVDALVIRHVENEWYKQLKDIDVPIINAGDGTANHPTQTLLDLLTIYQEFKKFKGLTVLIVGDIVHSRVAHSNIEIMRRLGMKVLLSAPKEFQDPQYEYIDFEAGIKQADVINLLRIQNERLQEKMHMLIQEYNKQYGLSMTRVKMMKPKSIIIHPAPFNRNVEIDDDVVECKKSRIFKQMNNGVYIRMVVLQHALSK